MQVNFHLMMQLVFKVIFVKLLSPIVISKSTTTEQFGNDYLAGVEAKKTLGQLNIGDD